MTTTRKFTVDQYLGARAGQDTRCRHLFDEWNGCFPLVLPLHVGHSCSHIHERPDTHPAGRWPHRPRSRGNRDLSEPGWTDLKARAAHVRDGEGDHGTVLRDPAVPSTLDQGPEDPVRAGAYCWVRTRSGVRRLTKGEYEALVQDRDRYEMFIDGMTREAQGRDGTGRSRCAKLTTREFGLLAEYSEAARPMRPRATKIGARCLSDLAAVKLFEKARAKVDVKLGRYEYQAFRLHRNPAERSLKAYEFAPPKAFRYCLILPV